VDQAVQFWMRHFQRTGDTAHALTEVGDIIHRCQITRRRYIFFCVHAKMIPLIAFSIVSTRRCRGCRRNGAFDLCRQGRQVRATLDYVPQRCAFNSRVEFTCHIGPVAAILATADTAQNTKTVGKAKDASMPGAVIKPTLGFANPFPDNPRQP
jgi:hypothetical protein